jgi:hypothetical protein
VIASGAGRYRHETRLVTPKGREGTLASRTT